MSDLRETDLADLVAGVLVDSRDLVEAEVRSLRTDLGDRLASLGVAIKSWMIAISVAIVTAMLLGLAMAATLNELGLSWLASLWIVTAIAVSVVAALVYRARAKGSTSREPALPLETITLRV